MTNTPISDEIIRFDFPAYDLIKLGERVKIYKIHDPLQKVASVKFILKRGASMDEVPGTSYLAGQMLLRGTNLFSSDKIAEKAEYLGSMLRVSAHWDDIVLSATSLSEHFPEIVNLMCHVVVDSTFPDDEFDKLRNKHISTIQQESTDISYLASTAFNMSIFSGGYSMPLLGTIESVSRLTRDDLFESYRAMTDNSNLSIILSGSFDENSIIAVLSEKFNSLSGKTISLVPSEISVITSRLTAINKDESNQAAIRLGRKMIDRNNPDFPYVQIANMIFGGFFLSRLNKILREEKGYTYGIHSLIDSRRQSTIQMIASSIKIDTLAESIGIISEVNSGLISNPISPDELKRAVRYILGSFLRSTETPQQISSLIQTLDMFGFDRKFYSDYYDKISSATLEDVHRVVHSHFTADDFVITAAGDLNIIRPQLEEFGNVEIIELN